MKNIKFAFAGAGMTILAGCAGAPGATYSESANYTGGRTHIQDQGMECDIYTQEDLSGSPGAMIAGPLQGTRTCASSSSSERRNSALEQTAETIGQVNNVIYGISNTAWSLQSAGQAFNW